MNPEVRRARIRSEVNIAGSILSRAWPLETFIAVNPLGGFEDLDFGDAIRKAGELLGSRGTLSEPQFRAAHESGRITDEELLRAFSNRLPGVLDEPDVKLAGLKVPVAEIILCDFLRGEPAAAPTRVLRTITEDLEPEVADLVDKQSAKWCAAYLDQTQASWKMPGREKGLYLAWKDLAWRDRSLVSEVRESIRQLPESPEGCILDSLEHLGVGEARRRDYLRAHLTRMPGWATHVRWRAGRDQGIDLVDYLAIRLAYESLLAEETTAVDVPAGAAPRPSRAPSPDDRANRVASALGIRNVSSLAERAVLSRLLSAFTPDERALVWLDAYEAHYRDPLVNALNHDAPRSGPRPLSQLVCCIDTRSEGLRRHFEESGHHETLGFAGFFAVAIRFQDLRGGSPSSLCPVLLDPRNEIVETPHRGDEDVAARRVAGLNSLAAASDSFHYAESNLASPFVLAEATGWAAGPLSAARTVSARGFGAVRRKLQSRVAPAAPTDLDVNEGFDLEERLLFGEAALTMMGLVQGFAPIVVLCGHGSTTENNPHGSSLDCGACGGSRGAANARTAAAILNQGEVRRGLSERGIDIPADTLFVPAEHDTATDQVQLLDQHLIPAGREAEIERITQDLARAGARLSAERCGSLPGAPGGASTEKAGRHVESRSSDWAQVFPEWGLAGNAAFVVGPRSLTAGVDLERRVFLHSYEASADSDGKALETILTAPLIVAQWINCQYYFSTVDPVVFGAGSKAVHNVVGGFGVLSGPDGDLQMGLPWQSVADGERLIHEPMRLLTIVQAPLDRIESIIGDNTVLQHLFGNGWLALAGRNDFNQPWMRHTTDGWQPWDEPEGNQ